MLLRATSAPLVLLPAATRAPGPVPAEVSACFSPGPASCADRIAEAIDGAQTSVRVQAYWLTSVPILRALAAARGRGVAFVRHSRELGFPLDDKRALLTISDDPHQPCAAVDAIARRHLGAVRSRIARLQVLEAELARMVEAVGHGKVAQCRVIEVLADQSHAHCLSPDHRGTGL